MEQADLIYIVDDIQENVQLLDYFLTKKGYRTQIANNGEEALKLIDEELPDLILLDISMPVMDGFETCEVLKNNDRTAMIPIIFITARVASSDILKGFKLGGADYITKPFNSSELLARVKTHLELQSKRRELEDKNKKLEDNKSEMQRQLEKLKRLSESLEFAKKQLERRQQKQTESLWYASRIQQSILPDSEWMKTNLNDHFIVWKPLDIVSGDFYWTDKIDNNLIIAIADCTGHGVPGAFMSIFGINFLDEIFREGSIPETNQVLEIMREKVKAALKQKGIQNEAKDGMDVALCKLNLENKKISFAGANNPLLVVRENSQPAFENAYKSLKNETHTIYYFKGDTQPVGIYFKERAFFKTEIQLMQGDTIYMFSDGFEDQFGGERDEKYGRKRFRKLLLNASEYPVLEQKQIIERELEAWKGNRNNQVDDIVIFGMKI